MKAEGTGGDAETKGWGKWFSREGASGSAGAGTGRASTGGGWNFPTGSWRDALSYAQGTWAVMSDTQRWVAKACACLIAFFVLRSVLGGPRLPFGLDGGRSSGGYRAGRERRQGGERHDSRYGSDYDDDGYFGGYSSSALGGIGTLVSIGVLYAAYKNGASVYTLMWLAQTLGLFGGGRRGGFGGMPYGMGGMGGRRRFGRGMGMGGFF